MYVFLSDGDSPLSLTARPWYVKSLDLKFVWVVNGSIFYLDARRIIRLTEQTIAGLNNSNHISAVKQIHSGVSVDGCSVRLGP